MKFLFAALWLVLGVTTALAANPTPLTMQIDRTANGGAGPFPICANVLSSAPGCQSIGTMGPGGFLVGGSGAALTGITPSQVGAVNKAGDTMGPLGVFGSASGAPFLQSSLGVCPDYLAGHFVTNWNTKNYLPNCTGLFFGDAIPYAATRGAATVGGYPYVLDRPNLEKTRLLLQGKSPSSGGAGEAVINFTATKGGASTATNAYYTALGITGFVGPDENGVDFPGAVWGGINADIWYAPNSGRHLAVLNEWDINNHNNSCGYDATVIDGCFQVAHWHQYNNSIARDIDVRVSPVVGPAYFGHATIAGTTLTAVDWELTQEGNAGPFSKGMFYVWLYPGSGLQTGQGTFTRVTSCASTTVCTLASAPGDGTYGFQHNPTQVRTGYQMDVGGDLADAGHPGRTIHANLIGEQNINLLDNAVVGVAVGGNQSIGFKTSGATNMAYAFQGKAGQLFCMDGATKCYTGDVSGYVLAPPEAHNSAVGADNRAIFVGNDLKIVGGVRQDQAFTKAALLADTVMACNASMLGAHVTVTDISGTVTWGQTLASASGGGAGVAAQPVYCDGGVSGWVFK